MAWHFHLNNVCPNLILFCFYYYFSENIRLGISCIILSVQTLFSLEKIEKKNSKCRLLQLWLAV